MTAGTRTVRTTSASSRMADASPTPNSAMIRWPPKTKAMKTQIMMIAAAVMTRPVAAWPRLTASRLSLGAQPFLMDTADEEYLIVHREPEQDRQHDGRQERLDRPSRARSERRGSPTPLEHRNDDPEGGPAESRFITAAVSGTSRLRNASISKRQPRMTMMPMNCGSLLVSTPAKSL